MKRMMQDQSQSQAIKFKFVFFPLQMLRFSALCGQIKKNLGNLWPKDKLKVY